MKAALAIVSLSLREVLRFVRQRSRLVGAFAQPLLFWLLLGGGMKASFRAGGGDYMAYFYPGIIALTLLFTAVFATISVVEDRKGGFLQGVLVAPVPRWSIVMGQAVGATVLAVLQGALLLALAPLAGLRLTAASVAASLGVMTLLALALTGLGLALAWRMDSTQGFHAIMNLVLMPMWLLSGAFFPAEGAPGWLAAVMAANPMTYGMAALRRTLEGEAAAALPGMGMSLAIIAAFGLLSLGAASALARRASA
jgi:ABC-2 type transport system permease protein